MANGAFSLVWPTKLLRKIGLDVIAGQTSFSEDLKIYFQNGLLDIHSSSAEQVTGENTLFETVSSDFWQTLKI